MQHILVIKLGALGDFIQATGPMAAIRKHHKDARISLLTTKPFVKMAKDCGYFDEILVDEKPKWYQFSAWRKLKHNLLNGNFDRVYDLQNNDRTGFYFKLFPNQNKPEWVGVAKGASHRNTSPNRTAGHAYDGHVQTLGLAGITDIEIDDLSWMKESVEDLGLKKPYILLVPGSAPDRPEKRWPAERYAALAKELSANNYQPVLLGTKAEEPVTDKIQELCPEVLNLNSKTSLYQIATCAREAVFAIGNDTGPMHLIAATKCPCLVLFSQHSNPTRHAPNGQNVCVMQKPELVDLDVKAVSEKLQQKLA